MRSRSGRGLVENEMPAGVIGHGQGRLVEDELLHRMTHAFTVCMWDHVVALPQLEEVGADG